METCAYCNAEIDRDENPYNYPDETVPKPSDNDWWSKEKELHHDNCEWVITRAHRLDLPGAAG